MSGNGLSHKDALCTRCLLKVNRYHKEINGPTAGDARGPRDLAGRPRQYKVLPPSMTSCHTSPASLFQSPSATHGTLPRPTAVSNTDWPSAGFSG